jgi:D-alanyl-D-alanine carboxypeptidase
MTAPSRRLSAETGDVHRSRLSNRCTMCVLLLAASTGCQTDEPSRRVKDCADVEPAAVHPHARELQTLLDDAVKRGLPGALMAVSQRGGEWYGASGAPDLAEPERRFRNCHLFPIKSISKTFVVARAMQLVEAGRLELDAPLVRVLSPAQLAGLPNTELVMIRHLMNHTSGIMHYPEVPDYVLEFINDSSRVHSVDESLDAVRGQSPYFPPGGGYHYSNTNTLLLQLIIERETGERLETELRRHVWQPLEMASTHLHQDEPLSDHVPWGYMDLYGNGDAHRIDWLDDVSSGQGGIESTLADLMKFSHALFDFDLLANTSVQRMMETVPTDEGRWGYAGAGLGLQRWETPLGQVYGHTGEDTGYKAIWHHAPDHDLTWLLFVNANYGRFADHVEGLRNRVLALLAE